MFNNNPYNNPYSSKRNLVYAKNGMVATSQPLAAQAGLEILKQGGNAIDAAIATAACLTVVEPTSNGIGGDAFALVWTKGKLHGLNASGTCPNDLSINILKDKGILEIPKYGFIPVLVPGVPAAWSSLSKKFGKLPLIDVLKPAIRYAKDGYPLSPTLAHYWNLAFETYSKQLKGPEFNSWFETFAPNNKAPKVGEIWKSKNHAATLEEIGLTNSESFYRGNLANRIDSFSKQYGGYIRKSDLENYQPLWVEPISINYRGYDVWEIPPNGQGLVALEALGIVQGFELQEKDTVETLHYQIEAIKLAFADGLNYITDSNQMKLKAKDFLTKEYLDSRRKLITDKANIYTYGKPNNSGTVYLATADDDGNMVSYIQSNYMGFGSGLVVPGTGIALQNRGHNFSMDPNHPNHLAPNKRTLHTIIPGFLTKDNIPIGPFGVMGGFMQPQGHMQVIMNSIDFKLNPQAALDSPRWQWLEKNKILVEPTMKKELITGLIEKGHEVQIEEKVGTFGRGQIIWKNPTSGVLVGGTEYRTDGHIAAW